MNKKKWDSLPDDIKKIIDRKHRSCPFLVNAGRVYDETDQPMKEKCLKAGMQIVEITPEAKAKLHEVTMPIREDWVKDMEFQGTARTGSAGRGDPIPQVDPCLQEWRRKASS